MACQIRRIGICRCQDEVPRQGAATWGTPSRAHNARPAGWEALLAQAPLARGLPSIDEDHHALCLWEAVLLEDLHWWAHVDQSSNSQDRATLPSAYAGLWLVLLL